MRTMACKKPDSGNRFSLVVANAGCTQPALSEAEESALSGRPGRSIIEFHFAGPKLMIAKILEINRLDAGIWRDSGRSPCASL
jgi:hypothetical protein